VWVVGGIVVIVGVRGREREKCNKYDFRQAKGGIHYFKDIRQMALRACVSRAGILQVTIIEL